VLCRCRHIYMPERLLSLQSDAEAAVATARRSCCIAASCIALLIFRAEVVFRRCPSPDISTHISYRRAIRVISRAKPTPRCRLPPTPPPGVASTPGLMTQPLAELSCTAHRLNVFLMSFQPCSFCQPSALLLPLFLSVFLSLIDCSILLRFL